MQNKELETSAIDQLCMLQQRSNTQPISIQSFHLLTLIGKGTYAKVLLVRKKDDKKIYALKVLKKCFLKEKNQVERAKIEKEILKEVNHPFIVKLAYSFQTDKKLYFVLEYCPGGELYQLLSQVRTFKEEDARFYASQIIEAIEYLHSMNIIYRDLKPENVVIDLCGYIKLTDFGLSKNGIKDGECAKSICGTPEYLAPEIVSEQNYTKCVDWWTLGAIIYEMVTGQPPYMMSSCSKDLFYKIQYKQVSYPSSISNALQDLLEKLLCKDPQHRLGNQSPKEIKDHQWFHGFDWKQLREKAIKPPFVPSLKSDTDVSYFDQEFVQQSLSSSVSSHCDNSENKYSDFTYRYSDPLSDRTNKIITVNTQRSDLTQSPEIIGLFHIHNFFKINFLQLRNQFIRQPKTKKVKFSQKHFRLK